MFDSLVTEMVLDSSGFSSGVTKVEAGAERLDQKLAGIGQQAQALGQSLSLYVTLPLLIAGGAAVKAASDAHEMQQKMATVFGEATADVQAWSKAHGREVNRSKFALQGYATALQDTFVPMGFARDRAAELSMELSELAVDLASFNNLNEREALDRLRSGLIGNHEALRTFGVMINQTTLENELMRQGFASSAQNATEMEKALARLAIIQRSTADAQGDAARTADSLANQLRGLKGDTRALGVEMGTLLIPLAKDLVSATSGAVQWMTDLSDTQQKVILGLAGVAAAAGPVLFALGTLGVMAPAVASGWGMLTGAMGSFATVNFGAVIPSILGVQTAALPIMPILLALAGGAALLAGAWHTNFLGIQNVTADVTSWVTDNFDLIKTGALALLGPIGWLYLAWENNLFGMQEVTDDVIGGIVDGIDWLVGKIFEIPGALKDAIDAIPGVDGDKLAKTLFPPKPVKEGATKTGTEAAKAMKPPKEVSRNAGFQMGQTFGAGAAAGMGQEISGDTAIKSWTPAIRKALEGGVKGYKSENHQAVDTEIRPELVKAMAANGGVSPEKLGVSRAEYEELLRRAGLSSGSSGRSSAGMSAGALSSALGSSTGGGRSGSSRLSKEELAAAIRGGLEGLAFVLNVETDDEGLEHWVTDGSRLVVKQEIQKQAKRGDLRGIKG